MCKLKILVFCLMSLSLPVGPGWAGNIIIKGSTTLMPVAQRVSEAFRQIYPEVTPSVSGGGSGNGIKAIIDGTTDIANSSRFIEASELKTAMRNNVYPVPFAVAYDCIIPVVHPGNGVENLTIAQLRAIYKGDITNWKTVGGPDTRIVVVSRDSSSGTYEVWEEKVLDREQVYENTLLQASNRAVVQVVSSNRMAVGYIGLGYLDDSVKAVMVNGVKGSEETTLNGLYPISRPLYMFTNGWPKDEVANFIRFMLHPQKGQTLVRQEGFVPLY